MASEISLKDVFRRYGLIQEQLDVSISFKNCMEFARKLTEWEPLAPRLDLENVDITKIKHDHDHDLGSQCSACLTKWQGKFGSKATFLKLAQALKEIKNMERIETLCEIFNTTSVPPVSENEDGVRKSDAEEGEEARVRTAEEEIRREAVSNAVAGKKAKKEKVEEQWMVERNQIIMTEEVLHKGKFGDIKVARFRGTRVAAKSFNLSHLSLLNVPSSQPVSPVHNNWHSKFISAMNIIATFRHPNLVQFLGACVDLKAIIVLTELMHTSLRRQLVMEGVHFTKSQIIAISLDVARALNYLHHRDIVHDSISSDHILLEPIADQQWKAKVLDNGLHNLQKVLLPNCRPRYISPSKNSTPESDIYSFGVVLVEMCEDIYKFGVVLMEMCNSVDAVQRASSFIKDRKLMDLVQRCTRKARRSRPSADEIIDELEQHHKD